jgi:hypothetical protein
LGNTPALQRESKIALIPTLLHKVGDRKLLLADRNSLRSDSLSAAQNLPVTDFIHFQTKAGGREVWYRKQIV